jgi:hypothetical protein
MSSRSIGLSLNTPKSYHSVEIDQRLPSVKPTRITQNGGLSTDFDPRKSVENILFQDQGDSRRSYKFESVAVPEKKVMHLNLEGLPKSNLSRAGS